MRRLIGLASVAVLVACGGDETASLDEAGEAAASAAAENEASASASAPELPDLSNFGDDYDTQDECVDAVSVELATTYDISPDTEGYTEVYEQAIASCHDLPAEPEMDVPEREGSVEGFCDLNLDSDLGLDQEGRYKALASIDAINTGETAIDVEVWVEFSQLGADPLRYTETVTVAAGETETVHFDENITGNQWDRYFDGARECNIGGDIVFGPDAFAAIVRGLMDPATCTYIDGIGVDEYVAELESTLEDLWRDDFGDVVPDVVDEEC